MAAWKKIALEEQLAVIVTGGTPALANGADQTEMQTILGVDAAGTDNSTNVTLSGSYDYLTLSGQVITLGQVDLAADVTGVSPVANGGTGASTLTANGVLIGNGTSAVTAVDMSTKGHILVGDGTGNPSALAVGTNDYVLVAASGEANGVKWESLGTLTSSGTVTEVTGDENITVTSGTSEPALTLDTGLTSMVSMTGVDVDAGTGDGAGGDLTFNGGVGTGTGVGGDIFFKVAPPASSTGTTQNTVATAVTIAAPTTATGDSTVTIHGDLVVNGSTSSVDVQTLTVEDKTILVADGAGSAANADGSGIIVDSNATAANRAHLLWDSASLGVTGWEIKQDGATATFPAMGIAVMNKKTTSGAPSDTNMPTGSMTYVSNATGRGLYIYVD